MAQSKKTHLLDTDPALDTERLVVTASPSNGKMYKNTTQDFLEFARDTGIITQKPVSTKTENYTLQLADANGFIRMDVESANTVTVPPNSSAAFPIGTPIIIRVVGAGVTSVVEGSGVTINNDTLEIGGQYTSAALVKVGTNEWDLYIAAAAAPGGGGYDADAEAYFTAQSISDTPTKDAVDAFIVAVKAGANTWAQIKGLYFFLGTGTVNARTPGTYDLSSATPPSITADGSVSNGTTHLWDTDIVPNVDLADQSESHGYYVKTYGGSGAVAGARDSSAGTYLLPTSPATQRLQQASDTSVTNAAAAGTYVHSIRTDGTVRMLKNGTAVNNQTGQSGQPATTSPLLLHASNNAGAPGSPNAQLYSASTLGIYVIGLELTNTQMDELSAAITTFITAMSRT